MEILGADPEQVEQVRRVTHALKCVIVVSQNEAALALHVSTDSQDPEAKHAMILMIAGMANALKQQMPEMFNTQVEVIEAKHIHWDDEG